MDYVISLSLILPLPVRGWAFLNLSFQRKKQHKVDWKIGQLIRESRIALFCTWCDEFEEGRTDARFKGGAIMIVGRRKEHPYYRTGGVSFGTRHLATSTTGCLNESETGTEVIRYVAGEDIDN